MLPTEFRYPGLVHAPSRCGPRCWPVGRPRAANVWAASFSWWETAGPSPPHGCRALRPAAPRPWPSIRYASRAALRPGGIPPRCPPRAACPSRALVAVGPARARHPRPPRPGPCALCPGGGYLPILRVTANVEISIP